MAGLSVQFVGIDEVLRAFDNIDCPNWAVWQGKNINFSYSGTDDAESRQDLHEWLMMLSKRGTDDTGERYTTQAVYTLKFYDNLQGRKITAATPEFSAFNFRLSDEGSRQMARVSGISAVDTALIQELKLLRQDIAEMKTKDAVSGVEQLEPWEKILDHPLSTVIAGKLFGFDAAAVLAADAKISGVPGEIDLDSVITELKKQDPALDQHLDKLLRIARNNPGQFKMLLSMLDKA